MIKKINFWKLSTTILLTGLVLVLVYQVSYAWTNPTANPPTGAGAITVSGGNVGIGTTNPLYKLDVVGDVNFTGILRQNGVAFSGSQWTTSGSNIYYNTGNVGIGTTAPDSNYKITTTAGGVKAENSSASQPAGYFSNAGGGPALVTGTGNVGIGTTNPTNALVLSKGDNSIMILGPNSTWGKSLGFGSGPDSNFPSGIAYIQTDNGGMHIDAASGGGINLGYPNSNTTSIWAGGSSGYQALYVATSGNVGIGTANPGTKLTLSRAVQAAANQLELRNAGGISDGNYDGIAFTQGSDGATPLGSIRSMYNSSGYPDLAFFTRSGSATESEKVRILNNGNVGIGTTSPDPNYKFTTSAGGVKAENNSASQPAGYFSNAGGGPALQIGTGGFVTETRTSDPASPVAGQIWLRTDL